MCQTVEGEGGLFTIEPIRNLACVVQQPLGWGIRKAVADNGKEAGVQTRNYPGQQRAVHAVHQRLLQGILQRGLDQYLQLSTLHIYIPKLLPPDTEGKHRDGGNITGNNKQQVL